MSVFSTDLRHPVPICLTHPLREITHTVTDSDQTFIFYHVAFEGRIKPLMKNRFCIDVNTIPRDAKSRKVGGTGSCAHLQQTANNQPQSLDFSALQWPVDTPCLIIYTSGTTGLPKVKDLCE